ncbi:hypothetical protein G6F43_008829 [Rhizopus delemar]|nr:hypothetical protein G6F43_008829 [Rhizopus delemar]
MTKIERNHCMRWHLGWLPGGTPRPCSFHPSQTLTKSHSIHCLNMHRRLQLPETMVDPLSFLLNKLLHRIPHSFQAVPPWFLRWPTICTILHELDYLCHDKVPPSLSPYIGQRFLEWLPKPPASVSYTNLVSFLIHIGYETELRSQLSKFNITVRDDFDPLDPSIIRDPTLVNEPIDRKVHHARKAFLHRTRVALRRFRTPVYNAVANFFVQSGLIDLDDLASYDLAPPYKYCTGHILDYV